MGRCVQLLKHLYRCGRSGVQIPGRLEQTQCRQRLATAATFLRSCVAEVLSHEDGLRYSLHSSAYASMMKILI